MSAIIQGFDTLAIRYRYEKIKDNHGLIKLLLLWTKLEVRVWFFYIWTLKILDDSVL